jgi:low temperature requirement protein LtrA
MNEGAATSIESQDEDARVTTLELFFDLVFVFTITQLTAALAHHPDGEGLLQVVLMLLVIWWMYAAFAWLTNAIPPEGTARRLFLLGGMACFLVISLAIPTTFSGDGVVFGVAYLAVVLFHTGLFVGSPAWNTLGDVLSFARFNLIVAGLLIVAGILGNDGWAYALWGIALALIWVTPRLLRVEAGDPIRSASHFVERHGLVVIVALGESVVAVGIGASGQPLTVEMLAVAVLGLALSAGLWWAYFGGDPDEPAAALVAFPAERKARVAVNAFYYCHALILLGIVADAAALERAIAHAFDPLDFARALALGGGSALFFAGDALYRRSLGLGQQAWLMLAGALALATIPLGTEGSALLQLGALTAVVGACLIGHAASTGLSLTERPQDREQVARRPRPG